MNTAQSYSPDLYNILDKIHSHSPNLFAILDIEEIFALEKSLRDGIIKWVPDEYEDGATEAWYVRENTLSHQVETYFDQ